MSSLFLYISLPSLVSGDSSNQQISALKWPKCLPEGEVVVCQINSFCNLSNSSIVNSSFRTILETGSSNSISGVIIVSMSGHDSGIDLE
eukprot:10542848-Ditylum_brightwellii.AAC.1